MAAVVIRHGRVEDVDSILEIVKEVTVRMNAEGNFQWNQFYPLRDDFLKDIERQELYVAVDSENNDQVLGMVGICDAQPVEYGDITTWDKDIRSLVPHRLAVSPFHQSKGVAQRLLQLAEELAREKGISRVRVDTNDQNHRVQHILEKKLGYEYKGIMQFRDFHSEIYSTLFFKCYEKILS